MFSPLHALTVRHWDFDEVVIVRPLLCFLKSMNEMRMPHPRFVEFRWGLIERQRHADLSSPPVSLTLRGIRGMVVLLFESKGLDETMAVHLRPLRLSLLPLVQMFELATGSLSKIVAVRVDS